MSWLSYILITLYFLLACCGKKESEEDTTSRPSLQEQYTRYLVWNAQEQDSNGFINSHDCDSLLFSSLNSIGRQKEINIEAAEISPGQWYRNPDHSGCSSSISRDMLTGLMAYTLYFHRLDIASRLWEYGVIHDWKMGSGDGTFEKEARTVMSPGQVGLLAKIIYHLGGDKHLEMNTPQVLSAEKGFAGHLTLLHIWMEDRIEGKLGQTFLSTLNSLHELAPKNPFVSYMYSKYHGGSQDTTSQLLSRYPSDRLPNSSDWNEQWLIQRIGEEDEQGTGDGSQVWSGGDFLFVTSQVLGKAS